jgi:hypothetical protein
MPSTPCVLWKGNITQYGYGRWTSGPNRDKGAHVVAWESAHGPVPKGMTIDHLCRVKHCVRVSHMEVVTRSENTRRKIVWYRHENPSCKQCGATEWLTDTRGARQCAPCGRARCARAYQRRKAAA